MRVVLAIFLVLALCNVCAQNGVGINETGASPHSSSILDLTSTKAGVLVPRMTLSQRNTNISSPATGLLIFQSDSNPGFYFYNGTAWVRINDGAVTADNGLNVNTTNNVRLGGSLLVNTTVDQGSNDLLFSGTGVFGIGATSSSNKLTIQPGAINTVLGINGFPASSTGKTGILVDMTNTASSNAISITNIGSTSMNGVNINSTANGNGTGIRLGETTTLSTGINIRGGTGILYNALSAASGTAISIGGTTAPLNGIDAVVSGAGLAGVFQSSTTGAGVFGLSISGSYSRPSLQNLTGVRGYTATNSNTATDIAYGVHGSSARYTATGGTSTLTYGIFGSVSGNATSAGNGLMVGTYGTASVTNPAASGTSGAIGGLFNASSGSTNLALAATGGADVYLGSTDADRPTNFTGTVVNVGTGNTNTTRMHNARLTGSQTFVGSTSGTVSISVPATITAYSLTLPSSQGTANSVLQNNGSGGLTWANAAVPSGVIVMWSGSFSSIPSGWALCDGTSGTPDLRNRFILGATVTSDVGVTGGAHSVTLSVAQLPSHTHTGTSNATTPSLTFNGSSGTTSSDGAGQVGNMLWDDGAGYYASGVLNLTAGTRTRSWSGTGGSAMRALNISAHTHTFTPAGTISGGSHTHTFTSDATGSGASVENRPAFYQLAYIMKL
jgi:hypothetical protein